MLFGCILAQRLDMPWLDQTGSISRVIRDTMILGEINVCGYTELAEYYHSRVV